MQEGQEKRNNPLYGALEALLSHNKSPKEGINNDAGIQLPTKYQQKGTSNQRHQKPQPLHQIHQSENIRVKSNPKATSSTRKGFFDIHSHNNLLFTPASQKALKCWDELIDKIDAYGLMRVRTNAVLPNLAQNQKTQNQSPPRQQQEPDVHSGSQEHAKHHWNGSTPRLFQCAMIQDCLFLCPPNGNDTDISGFAINPPLYMLNIEFSKLAVLRSTRANQHSKLHGLPLQKEQKLGFILSVNDVFHEFTIVQESQKPQIQDSLFFYQGSPKNDAAQHQKTSNFGSAINNKGKNVDQQPPILNEQANQEVNVKTRSTFKTWMHALNQWVVRIENLKKFMVMKELGVGGQAKVFKIGFRKHEDKIKDPSIPNDEKSKYVFAMKVINKTKLYEKSQFEQKQLLKEVQVMRRLQYCGNTIKLLKIYESDQYINLLMEFQEGGTLQDLINKKDREIKESDARVIAAQLLLTLDFMVRLNIVHRDLKPENILLNSREDRVYDVRIADFGFAMIMGQSDVKDQKILCGTPGYISPEALRKEGYNLKSDVFSVGAIIFSVLTKTYLFDETDYQALMKQNKACSLHALEERLYKRSIDARHFIRMLLHRDPGQRPAPMWALCHPWFQDEQVALKNSLNMNRLLATDKSVALLKKFFNGPGYQEVNGVLAQQFDSLPGQFASNVYSRNNENYQSRGEFGSAWGLQMNTVKEESSMNRKKQSKDNHQQDLMLNNSIHGRSAFYPNAEKQKDLNQIIRSSKNVVPSPSGRLLEDLGQRERSNGIAQFGGKYRASFDRCESVFSDAQEFKNVVNSRFNYYNVLSSHKNPASGIRMLDQNKSQFGLVKMESALAAFASMDQFQSNALRRKSDNIQMFIEGGAMKDYNQKQNRFIPGQKLQGSSSNIPLNNIIAGKDIKKQLVSIQGNSVQNRSVDINQKGAKWADGINGQSELTSQLNAQLALLKSININEQSSRRRRDKDAAQIQRNVAQGGDNISYLKQKLKRHVNESGYVSREESSSKEFFPTEAKKEIFQSCKEEKLLRQVQSNLQATLQKDKGFTHQLQPFEFPSFNPQKLNKDQSAALNSPRLKVRSREIEMPLIQHPSEGSSSSEDDVVGPLLPDATSSSNPQDLKVGSERNTICKMQGRAKVAISPRMFQTRGIQERNVVQVKRVFIE
ncbi:hypothetical protein FGO68_gene11795 [Halteria grandinella]|uniref:Protein kinase domain-containing protein n=1 Tax=Halteria grandinella TaxID=5974 RepID=A0A8J8T881_HALGN|nr:hypothetical protein FGO68_gene11795 [Halteria grandinella]